MQNDANKGSLTDKFRNFGAAPSDGLWDSIAATLDEKKKRRFGFWWWTTGLAATLLIATGIYFYGKDTQSRMSSYAHTEGQEQRTAGPSTDNRKPNEAFSKDGLQSVSPPANADDSNRTNQRKQQSEPAEENHDRSIADNLSSNNGAIRVERTSITDKGMGSPPENRVENGGMAVNVDSSRAVPTVPSDDDLVMHTDSIRDDSSFGRLPDFTHTDAFTIMPPKKWMVGVHVSRWQDNGHEPWMTTQPSGELSTSGVEDFFGTPGANGPYIHRHWSLEADIAYRFRSRLWLGSGIQVGYFASDRKTVSAAYTNAKLTAWTIGVPFNLNVDLIRRGRWQVYSGLGINLDFPLQRKLQYEPGSSVSAFSIEESTAPNGYLGSTQLNLGVRCRVWKNMSIDLRPTVRRYFECGPQNGVYLNNNWWWGVAAGVTYQF